MKDFDDYAGMSSGERGNCIERDRATLRTMLADYDSRLCDREMRAFGGKGLANVYRLGRFTRAADKAADRVAQCRWSWMSALKESFEVDREGLFTLSPVRRFVRHLAQVHGPRAMKAALEALEQSKGGAS